MKKKEFFTSINYSITQTRGGLGIQTGIEQPIEIKLGWTIRFILAKTSDIRFYFIGIWKILKFGNRFDILALCPKMLAICVLNHGVHSPN